MKSPEPTPAEIAYATRLTKLVVDAGSQQDALRIIEAEPIPGNVDVSVGEVYKWSVIAAVMVMDDTTAQVVGQAATAILKMTMEKNALTQQAQKDIATSSGGKVILFVPKGGRA